jgi:hypothetical protein
LSLARGFVAEGGRVTTEGGVNVVLGRAMRQTVSAVTILNDFADRDHLRTQIAVAG